MDHGAPGNHRLRSQNSLGVIIGQGHQDPLYLQAIVIAFGCQSKLDWEDPQTWPRDQDTGGAKFIIQIWRHLPSWLAFTMLESTIQALEGRIY